MRHVPRPWLTKAILATTVLLTAGCGVFSQSAGSPTNAPQPSPAAAASPFAKPGPRPSARPSAAARAEAVSPVASPAAAPTSAGPAVNAPLLLRGPLTSGFVLQSSAFDDGGTLPTEYSCDGPDGGKSPPLNWTGAPSNARTFALAVQDPDAGSGGTAFTHWVIFNLPASVTRLEAGLPGGDVLPNAGLQGQNGRRAVAYQPACPPAGGPPHHYVFQLWALSAPLALPLRATITDLQHGLSPSIVVGQTQLMALFGH